MATDELNEGYLPAEIEGNHQTIISSHNVEPDTLAIQHFGSWNSSLAFITSDRRSCANGLRRSKADQIQPRGCWGMGTEVGAEALEARTGPDFIGTSTSTV
jgi:hypothetical protein